MGSEWSKKKLVNLTEEMTVGFVGSMSKLFVDDGIPLLRGQNIHPYKLDFSNLKYVSMETHKKWKKSSLQSGDVVMVRVGEPGTACVIPEDAGDLNAASLVITRPNKDLLNSDFLCFYLNSPLGKSLISNSLVGSVQQVLNVKVAGALDIFVPPLCDQKRIADILIILNEKIELNRQTNQTLEQMAQALFKSWFVDFDPVIDNALAAGNPIPDELQERAQRRQQQLAKPDHKPLPDDIRQLFPSEFEKSTELTIDANGWIPRGWRITKLKDLISVKHGYAFKGKFFCDNITEDVLLTPGNVAIGGGFKGGKLKYYDGPIMEEYVFSKGDMYITMTDLSKAGDTLGYPAFVPEIKGVTFHHNQRLGKVNFKKANLIGAEFLYLCLCSREYRNHIVASATGTTVKHTSPTKILEHNVVNSGGVIEPVFEKFLGKISCKKELNNSMSVSLTKLRDTLLPKLISGELRLPSEALADAEQQPAGAIV